MAGTLSLIYSNNMGAGSGTVDLYSGNLQWAMGGWETSSDVRKDTIWETIDIVSTASAANIRTEVDKIDEYLEYAQKYKNNEIRDNPVWLYWQSDGESAKRSLVLDGDTQIRTDQRLSPLLVTDGAKLRVAIERMPFWESTTETTAVNATISGDGGMVSVGNDAGTYPQRISHFRLSAATGTGIQFWAGIRPTYHGTAGFISTWECEDGQTLNGGTAGVGAGASGGSVVTVGFSGTAALANRNEIQLEDITGSNYDDFVGRYLVLVRAQPSSGTAQFGIQMRYGFGVAGTNSTELIGGYAYVDGTYTTDYYLYELGEIQIPPTPDRGSEVSDDADFGSFFIRLYCEMITTGSDTLKLDCLYLVPSEHMVAANYSSVSSSGGPLNFYTGPDNRQWAVGDHLTYLLSVEYNFHEWYYPIGGGMLVLVGQGQVNHVLSNTFVVYMQTMPRYRTFRA